MSDAAPQPGLFAATDATVVDRRGEGVIVRTGEETYNARGRTRSGAWVLSRTDRTGKHDPTRLVVWAADDGRLTRQLLALGTGG